MRGFELLRTLINSLLHGWLYRSTCKLTLLVSKHFLQFEQGESIK